MNSARVLSEKSNIVATCTAKNKVADLMFVTIKRAGKWCSLEPRRAAICIWSNYRSSNRFILHADIII